MTAATDAPVEERHRRAAIRIIHQTPDVVADEKVEVWLAAWINPSPIEQMVLVRAAQAIANTERDGRASRDAEVAELRAYKRAWERFIGDGLDGWPDLSIDQAQAALAEELARKGTP